MFDSQVISADISSSTAIPFVLKSDVRIGGGDINEAYRLDGQCGRQFFLKLNHVSRLAMFEAEAQGLLELAKAKVIRVPLPICFGETEKHAYLVMEHIVLSGASNGMLMGQQLAHLHQSDSKGRGYGWHRGNTIGLTPQLNDWCVDWVEFLRRYRLGYQLDLAKKQGASRKLIENGQLLLDSLDFYFEGYHPQPSLLHGDLWGGNAAFDEEAQPVIYDPAVYYGDRETDIAMTELFGGFSQDFYLAYEQIWPLDTGYPVRRDIYKLYHVLNHFIMFGGTYGAQANKIIEKLLISLP